MAKSLLCRAVVHLKLSCEKEVGLELRCGFFGADLELLERSAGRPWVVAAELGQRVEIRALAETKADANGCIEASLRIHLNEVLSAASFLVFAAVAKHTEALKHPLLLEINDEGTSIHQVRRQEASGGPGTLLLVLSRSPIFSDNLWYIHDILPNNSAVCGERENTIIRELYWPEVGVAIQRSSPTSANNSNASVTWLEVFQAAGGASVASSDDEDIEGGWSSSGSDTVSVSKSTSGKSSSTRQGNGIGEKTKIPSRTVSTSQSDSDAACGYGSDLPLPSDDGLPFNVPAPAQANAKTTTIREMSSPEFVWPSDAKTPKPSAAKIAVPRFGNSPSPLSGHTNTSPSLLGDTSVDSVPMMMLGSPSVFNGPPSLATSPLGNIPESLSPEQRMLQTMVVEQPHAMPPANVQHHKASNNHNNLGARLQQLQQEIIVVQAKCDSQEKELSMAARTEARVLETESWALEQLSHERAVNQKLLEGHTNELRVANAEKTGLGNELFEAEQRVREATLRDEKSKELVQQSIEMCEQREAQAREQSREDLERLSHEIEDLRFSTDLQKNQLSQSQSLAAELRAEAKHLCEERDKNLQEAYAEKVRASQLQEQLSKEQAKLAEAQASNGNSSSSGAVVGKLLSSEDRRACSLLALQQRLQEATIDADRERGNTAEWRRVAEQYQEENAALLEKLQEGPREKAQLSTREERYELSQAQALIVQLRYELKAERARSQSLEDSLSSEASQMAQCRLAAKHGTIDATIWEKELNKLHAELRGAECEFHEELSSVRGRLVNADQRNRKLCESLRAAMQVAAPPANGHGSHGSTAPQANGTRAEEPPISPSIRHLARNASTTSVSATNDADSGRAGLEFSQFLGAQSASGSDHSAARSNSYVPRASAKPPRNLQGDYSRFVDCNQRSASDLGAMQVTNRSSSATPSPRGEFASRMLRSSHSQSSLPTRNALLSNNFDHPTLLLNDVSEGAPELGFGPGGPGRPGAAARQAAQSQNFALTGLTREYLTRGWR